MQTILLIECDPTNLVAQSMVLRCFGYTVVEADSPAEVWHAWYEHRGPIDMVLMKASPGGSISEFITRLQLLCPQIRALFVSHGSSAELADMPCEYTVLHKPFRPDALAETISGLLHGTMTRAVSSLS